MIHQKSLTVTITLVLTTDLRQSQGSQIVLYLRQTIYENYTKYIPLRIFSDRSHLEKQHNSVSFDRWIAAGSRCASSIGSRLSVDTALKSAAVIPASAAPTDRPNICYVIGYEM